MSVLLKRIYINRTDFFFILLMTAANKQAYLPFSQLLLLNFSILITMFGYTLQLIIAMTVLGSGGCMECAGYEVCY